MFTLLSLLLGWLRNPKLPEMSQVNNCFQPTSDTVHNVSELHN